MNGNKKQTELEQLIRVELLGIITRIAEVAPKNIIDENQQEFINSLKSVINHQIEFAWEVTKLLNDLDKKTPQDVRDQGERVTYYVSERIVNIADLENTIKNTQIMLNCLSNKIAESRDLNRYKDEIQIQLDSIRESLATAVHFEFLLERRRVAIGNNRPYEGL